LGIRLGCRQWPLNLNLGTKVFASNGKFNMDSKGAIFFENQVFFGLGGGEALIFKPQ
jgi:hypothetical protein